MRVCARALVWNQQLFTNKQVVADPVKKAPQIQVVEKPQLQQLLESS